MPHEAIASLGRGGTGRPDVVLGDRFGAAAEASGSLMRMRRPSPGPASASRAHAPFAGAYIAQTYGRPSRGGTLSRSRSTASLYMDEDRVQPRPDFATFKKALIDGVVGGIAGIGRRDLPLAAE